MFSMLEIEVNYKCNRRCSYCPLSVSARPARDMPPDLFELLVAQLEEVSYEGRVSYHFYNEPLLCRNLNDYVAHAKGRLPATRHVLYTNGDLLTEETFLDLERSGIDLFVVTKHEDVRPRHAFTETYANLDGRHRSKVAYLDHQELVLSNRGGVLEHIPGTAPREMPCFIPANLAVVTSAGNVLPCFEDFNEVHAMGNIREESIHEIWESEPYRKFREALAAGRRHEFEVCNKCNNLSVTTDESFDYVL